MKKKLLIIVSVFLFVIAAILGGIKLYRIHERDQSGILLAFDDYNAANWESYFDLFDEYDVKVTFFVNAYSPTEFCSNAQDRGHEIGYHTAGHANMLELTENEVYEQAIAPIDVFREEGIELTTFAYPYGAYTEELNNVLLQYYNIVRGAFYCEVNGKHNMRKGFVESLSLDNVNYESQEQYEEKITQILNEVKAGKGRVVSLYSHAISAGEWCVTEEKLLFLFQKAKELGLKFYTFQELQNW